MLIKYIFIYFTFYLFYKNKSSTKPNNIDIVIITLRTLGLMNL